MVYWRTCARNVACDVILLTDNHEKLSRKQYHAAWAFHSFELIETFIIKHVHVLR
jgi:hypothetical protein